MGKLKSFPKFRRKQNLVVSRLSDLLKAGIDPDLIMDEMVRVNREVWADITLPEYIWTKEMLKSQFSICPDFACCAFENNRMTGTASGFLTTEDDLRKYRSWAEKTGNGFFTHHVPDGNILFGADLSVMREASPRTATRLMLVIFCCALLGNNLKAVYLGSRIPGYHKYAGLKVEDYVYGTRKNGKPLDPELYFYLKDGFEIVEIIPEYMEDPSSLNYGVLVKLENPLYKIVKALPLLKNVIKFLSDKLLLSLPPSIHND